jgi:hypothetical protein
MEKATLDPGHECSFSDVVQRPRIRRSHGRHTPFPSLEQEAMKVRQELEGKGENGSLAAKTRA